MIRLALKSRQVRLDFSRCMVDARREVIGGRFLVETQVLE